MLASVSSEAKHKYDLYWNVYNNYIASCPLTNYFYSKKGWQPSAGNTPNYSNMSTFSEERPWQTERTWKQD